MDERDAREPETEAPLSAGIDETVVSTETMAPAIIDTDGSAEVATEPVGGPPDARRRARLRWLVASAIVVLAAGTVIAAGILLGRTQAPEALAYVPASAAVVAEMRLDLPGDQRTRVGNLLAHFPGFKDQSTLDAKVDEALTRIVRSASDGKLDYAADLKAYVRKPVFVFAPAPGSVSSKSRALLVLSPDTSVVCRDVVKGVRLTTQTYRDLELSVDDAAAAACAVDGRHVLVGSLDLLKAAVDTKRGGASITSSASFKEAQAALPADRLLAVYLSGAAIAPLASAEPSLAPALRSIPAWGAMSVRAEDAALVADVVTAPIPDLSAPPTGAPTFEPSRKSEIARHLPSDTLFEAEGHEVGRNLVDALAAMRENPAVSADLRQLEAGLAALGGAQSLLGWVDDAGLAVIPDGSSATGGLVLRASDPRAASDRIAQLRAFLTLGAGSGIQIRDEVVGGVTVTIVDLGDLASVLGAAGADSSGLPIPAGARLELAFAVREDLVVLGVGEAFVKRVLSVTSGASLADTDGYGRAMREAGAENVGQVYVDVRRLITLGEPLIPAADLPRWKTDVRPYLDPFRAIATSVERLNGGTHTRLVATVE